MFHVDSSGVIYQRMPCACLTGGFSRVSLVVCTNVAQTNDYYEAYSVCQSMEPHSHLEQEFLVHCPSDAAFVFLARVTADKVRQSADAAITLKPLPPFNFECALKSCPYEFPMLLGSQVIDKLLRLPLRFFENRPVGELSQRLSELGNLRSFLTGFRKRKNERRQHARCAPSSNV